MKKIYIAILTFIFIFVTTTFNEVFGSIFKKTIAIDLDGVLDKYNGKYNENIIPNIKSGAKEFIIKLSKDYKLILFTTRNSEKAKEWLIENNINNYFSDVTNVKPLAYIYIDDRALKFNGDYNKTLEEIKNFEVYLK